MYDKYLVAFSGGKDSLACLLDLIEQGVPADRIELHHHDVDGREGSDLFDWTCTRDYCRQVADHFGIPLYFSWLVGGLEGEMTKQDAVSQPTRFECPDRGVVTVERTARAQKNTRMKFPAKSASLQTRWCSAYAKIDVMSRVITNSERFDGLDLCVVTGERAEESAARAKYLPEQPHKTNAAKRRVTQVRPVLSWGETAVWAIIERHSVTPHPAYRLGWARTSCLTCIFGSKSQWASVRELDEKKFNRIAVYEVEMDHTIDNKLTVIEMADGGEAYSMDVDIVAQAKGDAPLDSIISADWTLPAGAFGDSTGPT